jgi:hypothetical protein
MCTLTHRQTDMLTHTYHAITNTKRDGPYLMLCILNCGLPQSTVNIPDKVAMMGPMVDPHPESDFTENSWTGTEASFPKDRNIEAEIAFVAYR